MGGFYIESGCADNKVYFWDVSSASDQPMALLEGHTGTVRSLAALPPSPKDCLPVGAVTRQRACEMLQHRMCVAVLEGHTETVWALAALPEGRLANGSEGEGGVFLVCGRGC